MFKYEIFAGDIVKLESLATDDYWLVTVGGFVDDRRVLVDDSGKEFVLEAMYSRVLERAAVPWEPGMVLRARLDPLDFEDMEKLNGSIPQVLTGDFLLVPGSKVNLWGTVQQEFPGEPYEFALDQLAEYEVDTFCAVVERALVTKGVLAAFDRKRERKLVPHDVLDSITEIMASTFRVLPSSGESLIGT